ncbi:MAG: preprotein translocase subunit YajC [Oligoflexia bacterium]|nr:preprotein translocase subunit YajC [Oligoflexia bacterium]
MIQKIWKSISLATVVYFLGTISLALAENPAVPGGAAPGGAPAAGQPQQPGIGGMLVPFLAMFAVIYFLMIRPQQKKMKEQQQMLSSLKHGDEVITTSGMLGTVTGITDKVITLEVADNVRVKMLKSQVSQIVKGQIKDLA